VNGNDGNKTDGLVSIITRENFNVIAGKYSMIGSTHDETACLINDTGLYRLCVKS